MRYSTNAIPGKFIDSQNFLAGLFVSIQDMHIQFTKKKQEKKHKKKKKIFRLLPCSFNLKLLT